MEEVRKMPVEDMEKCRKYSEVFGDFLKANGFVSAYVEDNSWILYGDFMNGEPETLDIYFDAKSLLKELKNKWIFIHVIKLIDEGKMPPATIDFDPIEDWLDKIPKYLASQLQEELKELLDQCE